MGLHASGLHRIERSGDGPGDPLLLIHGAVTYHGCRPLLSESALADRRRVIHYYRRGYPGSPSPEGSTIADMAHEAGHVLSEEGISRAHVLGHSIGSLAALDLAADVPDLVSGLVIVEPSYCSSAGILEWFQAAASSAFEAYGAGDSRMAADRLLRLVDGDAYRIRLDPALPPAWFDDAAAAFDQYVLRDLPAAVAWTFTGDRPARVRVPALVLTGAGTPEGFARIAHDVASILPDATRCVIPDAMHNVIATAPAACAAAIARFLARVEAGGTRVS